MTTKGIFQSELVFYLNTWYSYNTFEKHWVGGQGHGFDIALLCSTFLLHRYHFPFLSWRRYSILEVFFYILKHCKLSLNLHLETHITIFNIYFYINFIWTSNTSLVQKHPFLFHPWQTHQDCPCMALLISLNVVNPHFLWYIHIAKAIP